jgi:deoxyadenosine kinase
MKRVVGSLAICLLAACSSREAAEPAPKGMSERSPAPVVAPAGPAAGVAPAAGRKVLACSRRSALALHPHAAAGEEGPKPFSAPPFLPAKKRPSDPARDGGMLACHGGAASMTKAEGHRRGKGGPLGKAFIGIAGLIGAGKTTLATALGQHLDLEVHFEPVIDNEYLDDFYRDTKRYAFAMQIYLLNRRFQQHQEIIWRQCGGVQDRTIYEDAIFAKTLRDLGLMDPRDYETYVTLFRNMSNFMCRPNVIIYLDVTPEKSLERIKLRDRGCETSVSLDYLTRLYANYEEFLAEISKLSPVIRVQWNEFMEVEKLADAITREYTSQSFLRELVAAV